MGIVGIVGIVGTGVIMGIREYNHMLILLPHRTMPLTVYAHVSINYRMCVSSELRSIYS